jgi:3-oxoacyl-[acyl-carrier protein] reductase
MRLKDQTALITGGAQGIGRAIAETFAKEGANLALCDVNEQVCQATADELAKKFGVKTHAAKVNVTLFEECEKWVQAVMGVFGRVDILVNNAGITKDNLLMRMSDAEWDAVMAVNLKGPFNCTKAVVRPMFKAQRGRIINIASIVGLHGERRASQLFVVQRGPRGLDENLRPGVRQPPSVGERHRPRFHPHSHDRQTDRRPKKETHRSHPSDPSGRIPRRGQRRALPGVGRKFLVPVITGHVVSVNGGMNRGFHAVHVEPFTPVLLLI